MFGITTPESLVTEGTEIDVLLTSGGVQTSVVAMVVFVDRVLPNIMHHHPLSRLGACRCVHDNRVDKMKRQVACTNCA